MTWEATFEESSPRITDLCINNQITGIQILEINESMFDVLYPFGFQPGCWLWSTEDSRANAESAALAAAGITDTRES